MKFGKSIRVETVKNSSVSFINFKLLKRVLKCWTQAASLEDWDKAFQEDVKFRNVLHIELERVQKCFQDELQEILILQNSIQESLPSLDLQLKESKDFQLHSPVDYSPHPTSTQGTEEISQNALLSQLIHISKDSAALSDFCVNLGKISARCKTLRQCVLWNAVAIVKIMKKRDKHLNPHIIQKASVSKMQCAAEILSQQEWYRSFELVRVVSIVDTTTNTLMQRLTGFSPRREQYECPICLDVIVDPVSLRTCGHRFCWGCLCMAYCEKCEGTLERCPYCRCAFPLDPGAFIVDGILNRFLKTFFPETQSCRLREQRESLRHKFFKLSQGVNNPIQQHHERKSGVPMKCGKDTETLNKNAKTQPCLVNNWCCLETLATNKHTLTDQDEKNSEAPYSVSWSSFHPWTEQSVASPQKDKQGSDQGDAQHSSLWMHQGLDTLEKTLNQSSPSTGLEVLGQDDFCTPWDSNLVNGHDSSSESQKVRDYPQQIKEFSNYTCFNPKNQRLKCNTKDSDVVESVSRVNLLDENSFKKSLAYSLFLNSHIESNPVLHENAILHSSCPDSTHQQLPDNSKTRTSSNVTLTQPHLQHSTMQCGGSRKTSSSSSSSLPRVNGLINSFLDRTEFEKCHLTSCYDQMTKKSQLIKTMNRLHCSEDQTPESLEPQNIHSYSLDETIDEEDDEIEEECFRRKLKSSYMRDCDWIVLHASLHSCKISNV